MIQPELIDSSRFTRHLGTDHSRLRRSLLVQRSSSPQLSELVVAMDGDTPVSSGRVEFLPNREFASLGEEAHFLNGEVGNSPGNGGVSSREGRTSRV